MKCNSEFAELLGVIAGDGNLNVYRSKDGTKTDHKITISGHREDDFEYFKYLKELFKKLFNKEIKLRDKKRYIRLELSNKAILNKLNQAGIPIKKKSKIIEIPSEIRKNKKLSKSFLRGLADTDFSMTFKKGGRKKHSYPRISVDLGSEKIILQIIRLLDSLDIKSTLYKRVGKRRDTEYESYSLNINGKRNLYKWLKEIGFKNQKHLSKIKVWEKIGYYNPNTSLKERERILEIN
jgi:hypothetical protein